jgi:hypothetical protein
VPGSRAPLPKTVGAAQGFFVAAKRETQATSPQDWLREKSKFLLYRQIRMPLRNRCPETGLLDNWQMRE